VVLPHAAAEPARASNAAAAGSRQVRDRMIILR
jgi:hypothetical protein